MIDSQHYQPKLRIRNLEKEGTKSSFPDPFIRPRVIKPKGMSMNQLVETYCDVDDFFSYLSNIGKLYCDKGYISKTLSGELLDKGVELITTVRKNMKKKFISLWDKPMLKKRFIIETVNDQLKNISDIEHSRYHSMHGFC